MSGPGVAVVLVDHGSRLPAANEVAASLGRALAARARVPVEVAHLELAPPDVATAIERCVSAGAREIVVLPLFLAPGRHSTRDLPALAREAELRHPGVSVRCAEPLGDHPALLDALADRLSAGGGPRRRA